MFVMRQSLIHWNYQQLSRNCGKTEPVLIFSVKKVFFVVWQSDVQVQVHVDSAVLSFVCIFILIPEKAYSLCRLHSLKTWNCALSRTVIFPASQMSWDFPLFNLPLLVFVWLWTRVKLHPSYPSWSLVRCGGERASEADPLQGAACTWDPASSKTVLQ